MAGKTNTDLIRELLVDHKVLEFQLKTHEANLHRVDAAHTKTAETQIVHHGRLVALEEKVAELKKSQEENDRKRWMMTLAFIGALLTLVANLILTFVRK